MPSTYTKFKLIEHLSYGTFLLTKISRSTVYSVHQAHIEVCTYVCTQRVRLGKAHFTVQPVG